MRSCFDEYDCGSTGTSEHDGKIKLSSIKLAEPLKCVLIETYGDLELFPPQAEALIDKRILSSRRNFIIASPTNSGKTLLAILKLFSNALEGKRSVYVVPLKAIAQEKTREFCAIAGKISSKINIVMTTGDAPNDTFDSAPPKEGEIIITTPERMDSMMRGREFSSWLDTLSTIVIDEVHLIDDESRGPALECAVARLLARPTYPQLVCLSATIGNENELAEWLHPCSVVRSRFRSSALIKMLFVPKIKMKKKDCVREIVNGIVSNGGLALVFASTRKGAIEYARAISGKSAYYHAGLSISTRDKIRARFENGKIRALVTTTSLAQGVNLPATHVVVADHEYWDGRKKEYSIRSLLQMIGRAGRRSLGVGILLLPYGIDEKTIERFRLGLTHEFVEPITSHLSRNASAQALAELVIRKRATALEMYELSLNSFGKKRIPFARILEELIEMGLALKDGNAYYPTELGKLVAQSYIPPSIGKAFDQLLGDLSELAYNGKLDLSAFTQLDVLFAVCTKSEGRLDIKCVEEFDKMLAFDKTPLFVRFINEQSAARLLESLDIHPSEYGNAEKFAKRKFLAALAVREYARGVKKTAIARRFGVEIGDLESYASGIPWLLNSFGKIARLRGMREVSHKCAMLLECFS